MAMVCTSPHTVPCARNQTGSSCSYSRHYFLTSQLGCPSVVSFPVSEERRGAMKATKVRSKLKGGDSAAASVTMAALAEESSTSETAPRPFGVLFVCLGEIPLESDCLLALIFLTGVRHMWEPYASKYIWCTVCGFRLLRSAAAKVIINIFRRDDPSRIVQEL